MGHGAPQDVIVEIRPMWPCLIAAPVSDLRRVAVAKISWNPRGGSASEAPVAWGCTLFMREDGTFETDFKGETGFLMMKAAMDALQRLDNMRREPAYNFGRESADDWAEPPPLTESPKRTRRSK